MSFKGFKPGVHILILQIIITAILGFYLNSQAAVTGLFLSVNFFLIYWYGAVVFLKRLVFYTILNGGVIGLTMVQIPILSWVFPPFIMMIIKIYPVSLLIKLMIDKAPMNELLYTLEILHVPKSLSIPVMVVYRYVPTVFREIRYINESLTMRGLNLSFSNLNRIIKTLENYIVPLLFRSDKIAEELAAASLCKGLSVKRKRTCCTDVRFAMTDFIYLICMILVVGALLFLNRLST